MDLFANTVDLLKERAKDHVREGNIEKANQYINELANMLVAATEYIQTLESTLKEK
jgi:hypothetical protein